MRSPSAIASLKSCVTYSTVEPARFSSAGSSRRISYRSLASTLRKGSSSSRMSGSATSARASAVRCFCPLDSSRGEWSSTWPILSSCATASTLRAISPASAFRAVKRAGNVVACRHVRKQREILEGHADAALLRRTARRVAPRSADRAGIRRIDPREQAQQHGLAGSRRPEQGDDFALVDAQRHALQDRVVLERLAKISGSRSAPCQPLTAPSDRPSTSQRWA